jgi:dihydrofolate synthase/folylpolyglutamate synthase
MLSMTYDEALAFWYGRINYERRSPQVSDLKLDRMRELLHRLGDPHRRFPSVHVAGSKGKGSTCAMLAAVFRAAGLRTGLFTSPHLTDVRERIQIDEQLIERDDLVAAVETVRPIVEQLEAEGQPPTFFEVATALGFLHFARREVEIAVVEVGLGGRFDSTNVLSPLVSIITSISLDHTAILGDTLEKIAFEKAGIIKAGTPALSGVLRPGPRAVIEQVAADRGATLWRLGAEIDYRIDGSRVAVTTPAGCWPAMPVPLLGDHQARNAALVIAAVDILNSSGILTALGPADVERGLSSAQWPARIEVIRTRPTTIFDCAHNVASAEALAATLLADFPPASRTLIFAASNDKDVAGMFRVLAPLFERIILTRADTPRAIPPAEMAKLLPGNTASTCVGRPADAWLAAHAATPPDGLIVVAGSVFLAGELRPIVLKAADGL